MERNTTAYQLNILRDTQMVQRRLLEKQFPYIDWERMPFSSYGDFFRLRGILDDCGAVWTNAYGRSNTEADGQRNFLEDYSGNGRDIELFNFGWTGISGYAEETEDFTTFSPLSDASVTSNRVEATSQRQQWLLKKLAWSGTIKPMVVRAKVGSVPLHYYYVPSDNTTTRRFVEIKEDGVYSLPGSVLYTSENLSYVGFYFPEDTVGDVVVELVDCKGALVGDGVDDYGQCVKDFALPDDYTVVAMRERLGEPATLIGKNINSGGASAFDFETGTGSPGTDKYDCHSYGGRTRFNTYPKLFSYQTKTSYNGIEIAVGTSTDTAAASLTVFKSYVTSSYHVKAALYSFGIFTRTLTADELRTVENCMYAEWIAMTGKLEDIEYYDILDARFRSNEEDADKRNKWVGRLGKLHMTLNNYGYSQMSGWDGYPINWESWNNVVIAAQGGLIEASKSIIKVKNFGAYPSWSITSNSEIASIPEMRIKISGLKTGASLFFIKQVPDTRTNLMTATRDGIYTVPADTSAPDYYAIYCNGYSANEDADLTIELIPDYGGALVQDGVDDYAISDEMIDEEIGGFVCYAEFLEHSGYVFSAGAYANAESVFYCAGSASNQYLYGNPNHDYQGDEPQIIALSKSPLAPNSQLYIGKPINETAGASAFYQLRLIKNQPTDVQLEAIKWQCRKEHDDYLIHMGWKEVE